MNEHNYIKRFTRGLRILKEMTYFDYKGDVVHKQNELLTDMLSYAVKHCRYYKNVVGQDIQEPKLSDFPLLTKQVIRDNFEDMISDEKNRFIYWDAYTGGSTGEPLYFISQSCIDLPFMTGLWKFMGYKRGDIVVAMACSKVSEEDRRNNIYWAKENKGDIPYGRIELSSLYYNDSNAKYYIDFLNGIKPDFIRGYPSFIYEVAKYILDNGISLSFAPRAIQMTSESSFEYQYDVIKRAFGTDRIHLAYGHTEQCVFGYTYDSTYEYVIEPLYGYTEILDDQGNEVGEGEVGEIVVTSFYNKVMPFIRYRTGDKAVRGKTVDGKLHLKRIMGRTQDYIVNRNGDKVLLTALIFGQHFEALGKIVKWQIEQFDQGVVTMHIIRGNDYSDSDELQIGTIFDKVGNVDVIFDYVTEIDRTGRGKSPMLVQHIVR